jgi:hypothetical protein
MGNMRFIRTHEHPWRNPTLSSHGGVLQRLLCLAGPAAECTHHRGINSCSVCWGSFTRSCKKEYGAIRLWRETTLARIEAKQARCFPIIAEHHLLLCQRPTYFSNVFPRPG